MKISTSVVKELEILRGVAHNITHTVRARVHAHGAATFLQGAGSTNATEFFGNSKLCEIPNILAKYLFYLG